MNSKSLIKAAVVAVALAAPLASFAQSNGPVTRAQVRQELIDLERAGYNPAVANDATYPAEIQAAEARVAAQKGTAMAQQPTADTGYGPSTAGSSQAGQPAHVTPQQSIYFGN